MWGSSSSASSSSMLTFLYVILVLSPWMCSCHSVEQSFLQCLSSNRQSNFPISEAIFTPNNSSFLPTLNFYIRNLRFKTPQTPKPVAIVAAKHKSHVQTTVICAKRIGLQIRIRSGGHDYEGLSYVSQQPFIVLDLFNLRAINVNIADQSAWVQAGATTGELYYAIANKSRVHAFPGGVCTTLGAGGHLSGGGYGTLIRKFGLSVDNIVDAQIVNVEGQILNRQQMGEDLFWAIRGGGGGSFGVILSWKIKLVPVPSIVTVFNVDRTVEEGASDIVWQYQQVMDKLDENLFIRLLLHASKGKNDATMTGKASFLGLYLGPAEKLLEIVNQNIPSLKLEKQNCNEMSWIQSVMFWVNFPNGTAPEALLSRELPGTPFLKRKSDFVREPISKEGIESIWKAIIEIKEVGLAWNPYGGRMAQISETATPFPHRAGVKFLLQYSSNWKEGGDVATNQNIEMLRRLHEAMTPYVSKNPREAFLNYRDIDLGSNAHWSMEEGRVYGEKYFKENFDRLVTVKTKVDPENFFKNEQSIPTR